MKPTIRKFWRNKNADVSMILAAVVMGIVFAISITIIYSVLGGIDYTSIDAGLTGTPAQNASDNVITNLDTFYTLGPIAIIVVAAVAIISYVMLIGPARR